MKGEYDEEVEQEDAVTLRVVMRNSTNDFQWQLISDVCLPPNWGRRLMAYVTINC